MKEFVPVPKRTKLFSGAAYPAPERGTLLNDVAAPEDGAVFFFDVKRVITKFTTTIEIAGSFFVK